MSKSIVSEKQLSKVYWKIESLIKVLLKESFMDVKNLKSKLVMDHIVTILLS